MFDCKGAGTGFIGLTDRRVILQDRSFVGGKIALVSLPFSRIASVAILTNKSVLGAFWSSSELMIVTVGAVVTQRTSGASTQRSSATTSSSGT